jgi:hypothetical protein
MVADSPRFGVFIVEVELRNYHELSRHNWIFLCKMTGHSQVPLWPALTLWSRLSTGPYLRCPTEEDARKLSGGELE